MLRKAQHGKFKANISRGGVGRPLELDPEVEWLSTEAARVLGLEIAGVDILFDRVDNDAIELIISDNGLIMPKDQTIPESSASGLELVRILVEDQLEGHLNVVKRKGTEYKIRFKYSL